MHGNGGLFGLRLHLRWLQVRMGFSSFVRHFLGSIVSRNEVRQRAARIRAIREDRLRG